MKKNIAIVILGVLVTVLSVYSIILTTRLNRLEKNELDYLYEIVVITDEDRELQNDLEVLFDDVNEMDNESYSWVEVKPESYSRLIDFQGEISDIGKDDHSMWIEYSIGNINYTITYFNDGETRKSVVKRYEDDSYIGLINYNGEEETYFDSSGEKTRNYWWRGL